MAGLFLGILYVRLKECFLGLVTFGFAIIIIAAFVNESSVFIESLNGLPGATGLSGNLDPNMLGGSLGFYSPNIVPRAHYYYLFFFAMVGTILVSHVIIRSKIGFAFAATRENQAGAGMMGVDITHNKMIAFMINTFMADLQELCSLLTIISSIRKYSAPTIHLCRSS